MHRQRNAKIVATLGPASDAPERVLDLAKKGVDVFRLNFSHGTQEDHRRSIEAVRAAERQLGYPIGVLMDLQGPKLRIGAFRDDSVQLQPGQTFRLDRNPQPGDNQRVCLPHPELYDALRPGAALLLDDGRLRLEVTHASTDTIETRVLYGGKLSAHKGLNVPDLLLPLSPLTEKDRNDLEFGLGIGVDWVALSFVQRPADVEALQSLVGGRAAVLSKLEKPAAISHLDDIIAASDAIMIARGDLGVELPPEQVPGLQKRITHCCRRAGKPVVVATQMLESMVNASIPTRAEVSDVATAVFEGADAVMLSAETASGRFPVEAVTLMDNILATVERDSHYRDSIHATRIEPDATIADAICGALNLISNLLPTPVVVTYTHSGFTSLRAARERPQAPILCLTPMDATARRLTLAWGAYPVIVPAVRDIEEMVRIGGKVAVDQGFAKPGEPIIVTAGLPTGQPGTTNLLRIARA